MNINTTPMNPQLILVCDNCGEPLTDIVKPFCLKCNRACDIDFAALEMEEKPKTNFEDFEN